MVDNDLFKTWKNEYIDDIDLNNIEYLNLTPEELSLFLYDNYFDQDSLKYVSNEKSTSKPIGLVYLDYEFYDIKNNYEKNKMYLIGIVKNNAGKKTIVSVFKYCYDHYFFDEQKVPLTYIMSVEVNQYFRQKGLFKKLILESLKYISLDNPIIITIESEMGYLVGTHNIIKTIYRNNGFNEDIRSISEFDKEYESMLMGNKILTK